MGPAARRLVSALVLLALVAAAPDVSRDLPLGDAARDDAGDPSWVAEVVGAYDGTVRNAGEMQCHRTTLSLQGGHLVGHYWIEAKERFEGTLTEFVPESDTSGHFTWTDRYGSGVEMLIFSSDRQSFDGAWGLATVDPNDRITGVRGGTARCANAVS